MGVRIGLFKAAPNSGLYIFRPEDGMYQTLKYNGISGGIIAKPDSGIGSIIKFYLTNPESDIDTIEISIDPTTQAIKVEVDLASLPKEESEDGKVIYGYEVLAIFSVKDFVNGGTFYTDSNGLDMQKRVLNYRADYEILESYDTYPNMTLSGGKYMNNITTNFYPVTSAL